MKKRFKFLCLFISLIMLLGGCNFSSTYTQNVVVSNNAVSTDGKDNFFNYDESDEFLFKSQEELEKENAVNQPDVLRYAPKFTYSALGENVMPIIAYVEPNVTGTEFLFTVEEAMKDFSLSGCNILNCVTYNISDSVVYEMMQYGEELGYMMLLKYNTITNLPKEYDTPEEAKDRIYSDLSKFYKMKSFAGVHVVDEPGYRSWVGENASYGTAIEYWRNAMNSKLFFVNLLPIYSPAWAFPSGATGSGEGYYDTDYMYYYETYIENVKPQVFCYDYYPCIGAFPALLTEYFYQLTIVKELCEEAGIPFWVFIQNSDWGGARDCTYAEIAWQVNTSLAFGAKGIQYYTYGSVSGATNTFVNADGTKNRSYYDAQKVNAHVAAVDEWLLNSNVKAIIQYGVTPNGETLSPSLNLSKSYKSIASSSGVAHLISCMDYYENNVCDLFSEETPQEVYYVCNNSITTDGDVTVNFTKELTVEYIVNGEKHTTTGSSLTVELAAGEACAIKVAG